MTTPFINAQANCLEGYALQTRGTLIFSFVFRGQIYTALLDTGANTSMIKPSILDDTPILPVKYLTLVGPDKKPIDISGFSTITFKFHKSKVEHKHDFIVTESIGYDAILGTDFLGQFDFSINAERGKGYHYLRITNDDFTRNCLVELRFSNEIKVPWLNCITGKNSRQDNLSQQQLDSMLINPDLTQDQKKQLQNVLATKGQAFAWNIFQMGKCNLAKYHIDTGDHEPIAERLRQRSQQETKMLRAEVKDLLEGGIIEPASSPWAANCFLVPKPPDPITNKVTWRMVVGYNKINAITKKDRSPISSIKEILSSLNGCKWFCRLDLFSGYYQIIMCPCCVEKTAFITGDNQYVFRYMSFGMANSPAVFSRLMRLALGELLFTDCLSYLDDILIYATSFEELLVKIDRVLSRLILANLTLKPSKCTWAFQKTSLLGHIVSPTGIHCDPAKLEAMERMPPPKTKREVQCVLGLFGYYRAFVRNFADLSKPLSELLRSDTKFSWTPERQAAFDHLKTIMLSTDVLIHHDPEAEIELHCDASDIGMGSSLMQFRDGKRRPITFASRTYTPAESRYTVTERECLSIIWSIKRYEFYLFNRPFKIITDHHALCSLKFCKSPINNRLARWALDLAPLDFTIVHQSGKNHLVPDCLSRLPVHFPSRENDEILEIPFYNIEITSQAYVTLNSGHFDASTLDCNNVIARDGLSALQTARTADPILNPFIQTLQSGKLTPEVKNYTLKDNVLYYTKGLSSLLVIPTSELDFIIRLHHDPPLLGHMGIQRTYHNMKNSYYFPKLLSKVTEFVNACSVCQKRKPAPYGFTAGKMASIVPEAPWDLVSIDCTGPYPCTRKGFRYIILAIDHATRYVITRAIRRTTSSIAARFILDCVICHFGVPKKILSDNASIFRSNFFRRVNNVLGTINIYSTPYHSMGNSLTERQFRTLQDVLSKYVQSDHRNWDRYLGTATFAINTTIQESLRFSPYYLLYGRNPRMPLDVYFDRDEVLQEIPSVILNVQKVREKAIANLQLAQKRSKTRYDLDKRDVHYAVGDQVMIYTPITKPGLARKLTLCWNGPYRILKRLSPLNYIVEAINCDLAQRGQEKVHVRRMKLFHSSTPTQYHSVLQDVDSTDISDIESDSSTSSSDSCTSESPNYS